MMGIKRCLGVGLALVGLLVVSKTILAGAEKGATANEEAKIGQAEVTAPDLVAPYLLVLGIAQDAGVPQAGRRDHPGWEDPSRRELATSLALVDPAAGKRYLFDATPDFKFQLNRLDRAAPAETIPGLDGIFLTHAHIGHYTGLMMLGHEVMGSRGVPVFAMPRMADFLRSNGPWSQLVRYQNIDLRPLEAGVAVQLRPGLQVTPLLVPHRQEFSEVVGFRIEGPQRSALFLPDIDRWEDWDQSLEDVLTSVDVAYVDGSFYANGEIPGRDMSGFPHPFVTKTMNRLADQPLETRHKVRFIHFNHTNPVLVPESAARQEVAARGFRLAEEGETFDL
jgi:pyrroloquinoline quinone biosynthesis protein B